jgi:alpha-L-fucosidase
VGGWLDDYGEAVYGTERSPIGRHPIGLPTCKGTTLYEHVLRWPGSEVIFAGIETECVSASLLPDAEPVEFTQKGPRIICTGLPEHAPNIYSSVIKLEFAEKPEPWDLMHERWWPSADMTG